MTDAKVDLLQGIGPFQVRWEPGLLAWVVVANQLPSRRQPVAERIKEVLDEASETPLAKALSQATGFVQSVYRVDPILREQPINAPKTANGDRVITYLGPATNGYRTLAWVFEDADGVIRWEPWPCRVCSTQSAPGSHQCPL